MILKLDEIKKLLKSKIFYLGLFTLILGIILNQLASVYIFNNFKDIPVLRDSILNLLPTMKISWAFDILSILSILIFIIYAYTKEFKKIPYFILIFGILQIIRGIFIVLTPFSNPDLINYNGFLQKSEMFRRGLFPSGHTGSSFLAFLLTKGKTKIIILIITFILIVSLLLAKGHYSIDIFSALLFAYAIYCFGEKKLKKRFILK